MISAYEADKLAQGYYTYSGTVLLRRDSSGSSQSLLLFLRDLGMRWVSAPGATGKKSRFGGATEPLVWAEYHLYQSTHGLYLQNAEVREDFLRIRSDRRRLLTAMRCYKRVRQILMEGHESNQILILLWNAMLSLNANCPAEVTEFRFNWRLLRALGLAPSLLTCSECGSTLKDELNWSPDGLLCGRCKNTGTMAGQPANTLADLQKAALLGQANFLEWSVRQVNCNFFSEHMKKLIRFFANFN